MEGCPVHSRVFSSISTHQITVVPSQFGQSNVYSDAKLGGKLTQMRACLVEIIGSHCVCDLIWFIPTEDYRLYLVVGKGKLSLCLDCMPFSKLKIMKELCSRGKCDLGIKLRNKTE